MEAFSRTKASLVLAVCEKGAPSSTSMILDRSMHLGIPKPFCVEAVRGRCPQQHTHEPKPLEPPWLTNPKYKGYKRKDIFKRKQKQKPIHYIINIDPNFLSSLNVNIENINSNGKIYLKEKNPIDYIFSKNYKKNLRKEVR